MHSKSLFIIGQICLAVLIVAATAPATWSHDTMGSHFTESDITAAGALGQASFFSENEAAMIRMMAEMEVEPTGDVNVDFAAMMIPHHQGAVDMAVAYLRYGDNSQLLRLAQEIVVEQQQEIVAMRMAIGQQMSPSGLTPANVCASRLDVKPGDGAHDHSAMSHGAVTKSPAAQ